MGFLPMTPGTRPFFRPDTDALALKDLRIPAADGRKIQETLLVDVRDLHADFVDVPRQHDARAATAVEARIGVAVLVAPDVRRDGPRLVGPDPARLLLEPRRLIVSINRFRNCSEVLSMVSPRALGPWRRHPAATAFYIMPGYRHRAVFPEPAGRCSGGVIVAQATFRVELIRQSITVGA